MKMSDLKTMEVGDILDSLDLPDSFVDSFREWCEKQPTEPEPKLELKGLNAWLPDEDKE